MHARSINMSLALASSVRAASAITFLTLSVISTVVSMGLAGCRKSDHCSAKTVTELHSSPQSSTIRRPFAVGSRPSLLNHDLFCGALHLSLATLEWRDREAFFSADC